MKNKLNIGDRVVHLKCKEWGIGEVFRYTTSEKFEVFFLNAGVKTFPIASINHLSLLTADEGKSSLLDNLRVSIVSKKGEKDRFIFKSLYGSIQEFKEKYEEGFEDLVYFDRERNYKIEAHNLAIELLNESTYKELLDSDSYEEIFTRLKKIISKQNFFASFESMAYNDAFKDNEDNRIHFVKSLYEYLYSSESEEYKFDILSDILGKLNIAKWPIFTVFGFLFFPERSILIKPEQVKGAAELSNFDIKYDSKLNWQTYKCTKLFYDILKRKLEEEKLYPKDMIDVQSFMWEIKLLEKKI